MCDEDADGEDEADFVQQPDGTYVLAGVAQQECEACTYRPQNGRRLH